jgi:hypothetical protein
MLKQQPAGTKSADPANGREGAQNAAVAFPVETTGDGSHSGLIPVETPSKL